MNNHLSSPFKTSSQVESSGLRYSSVILPVFVVGLTSAYLLIANILGRIGLDQAGLFGMVTIIPVIVFLVTAFGTRISGSWGSRDLALFTRAGGNINAWSNALAGTAEWFSLYLIIGIISALSATNHDASAILTGAFCGFAFMAIFIFPKLPQQGPLTLAGIITSRLHYSNFATHLLRFSIAIIVILCAMTFLVGQIKAGSDVIVLYFPMSRTWAGVLLLAPVVITLLSGGMRSLTIANMLLVWLIGAAILLPVVWLSIHITGNPVPQLSYGNGALQPIMQLEEQLAQISSSDLDNEFEQGNFGRFSSFSSFLATVISIMAGTLALPLLYSRISCSTGVANRLRSIGWMLILIALLVSTLPAFFVFTKFEIYRDLVGLPVNRLENGMDWLMNWANIDEGKLALICGKPAFDLHSIIAACGNDPEYVLMPSDLQINPLVTLLGSSEITEMPSVFSAVSFAGLLSASATTAGIAMMVIINAASEDLIFSDKKISTVKSTAKSTAKSNVEPANLNSDPLSTSQNTSPATPVARRLFISRIMLIILWAGGIWLADATPLPVTDFSLWAFSLAAGTISPVLLLAIWWKPTTVFGALTGILTGFAASIYLMISIEYGSDWIAYNGDELVWLIPFSDQPLKVVNTAILVMPIIIVIAMITSFGDGLIRKSRASHPQESRHMKKNQ